ARSEPWSGFRTGNNPLRFLAESYKDPLVALRSETPANLGSLPTLESPPWPPPWPQPEEFHLRRAPRQNSDRGRQFRPAAEHLRRWRKAEYQDLPLPNTCASVTTGRVLAQPPPIPACPAWR